MRAFPQDGRLAMLRCFPAVFALLSSLIAVAAAQDAPDGREDGRGRDHLCRPFDLLHGAYTMSLDGISEITRRLRASVVLPMHRFMTPLDEFMYRIGQQVAIDVRTERTLQISRGTLPGTPTVVILRGV
jgi:hypothetical protein